MSLPKFYYTSMLITTELQPRGKFLSGWFMIVRSRSSRKVRYERLPEFPYSSGSKGTAAKIKLASDPFLVSFFSHVSSGSSGFFAYFFMPSQILCAFLQVCALFFLAIKFDLLWSRERHNALSSFRAHITYGTTFSDVMEKTALEALSWVLVFGGKVAPTHPQAVSLS